MNQARIIVSEWIGGPMVGFLGMIHERAKGVVIVDREKVLGRYELRDGAWHWIGSLQSSVNDNQLTKNNVMRLPYPPK